MIFCINCKTDIKKKMDTLLTKCHYKDYSQLIEVAIENLWILEHEVAEKGALFIDGGWSSQNKLSGRLQSDKKRPINPLTPTPITSRPNKAARAPLASPTPPPTHIPELFLSEGLADLSCNTIELPQMEVLEETFTLDRWLFGQYNKLLPIKANCRAMVRLTTGQKNGVLLETLSTQIAEAAQFLGDFLADHDLRHNIDRDEALATAFPHSGSGVEKSRTRYANQFVGSINSQKALSGLLWDYRLIGLTLENGPRLLPTEKAILFAQLTNPILDGCQTTPAQKFSKEETTFLLEHIRSCVPVEAFTFQTLIKAVADGADTPDKLDESLRSLIPNETNRSLSPSFLTSQRSGALSRMADLGLISRQRKGVRVLYVITDLGYNFRRSL